jgi:mercuric ion transport protein
MSEGILSHQDDPKRTRAIGASGLALGGLATAFAAASCCALPIALSMVGLGSAWLGAIAFLAGPYQQILLWAALFFIGMGLLIVYRRPVVVCGGDGCKPRAPLVTKIMLWLAAILVVTTFLLG